MRTCHNNLVEHSVSVATVVVMILNLHDEETRKSKQQFSDKRNKNYYERCHANNI